MNEHIEQLLARAESTLTALQSTPHSAAKPLALQFGHEIGKIGRELTQHPELGPAVHAFVERTAPIIRTDTRLSSWIHRVYDAAESRSSDTEVYLGALALRSELEFFRTLYRDSAAGYYVSGIETDETDADLREWGSEQYLDEIPPGFPPSHIWWHQSLSGK